MPPTAFPKISSVALTVGGFENITVAGPCGNLTRFPILPETIEPQGTRSMKVLKSGSKLEPSTRPPAESNQNTNPL
jgi:hypothetical protein